VDTLRASPWPFPHAGHCCSTGIAKSPRLVRVATLGSIQLSRRKINSVICNRIVTRKGARRLPFRRAGHGCEHRCRAEPTDTSRPQRFVPITWVAQEVSWIARLQCTSLPALWPKRSVVAIVNHCRRKRALPLHFMRCRVVAGHARSQRAAEDLGPPERLRGANAVM
jgi:hypothetical protein